MNYNKKGQAAMEFLMTYGWAILAAIVVIAVLAIYFRPSGLVSSNQIISAPFNALGTQITGQTGAGNDGEIILEIRNNGGETVDFQSSTIDINTPAGATCATAAAFDVDPADPGSIVQITYGGCDFDTGDSISADVSVVYLSGDGTLSKTSSGTLNGKAQ